MNERKVLAVVDSSGMVWANPSDVDPEGHGIVKLYTQEQVEDAMRGMEARTAAAVTAARKKSVQSVEEAAEDAAESEIDMFTFHSLEQKLSEL